MSEAATKRIHRKQTLMTTQEITLDQNSDDGTITLDDGTELYIHGNEGRSGCESGWYWLN